MRVRACALNHLDLWLRNGVPGHRFPLPLVPGSEVAGDVAAIGAGVTDLAEGTPCLLSSGVSCGVCARCLAGLDHLCSRYGLLGEHRDGGYAELITAPEAFVYALPDRFDDVTAAPLLCAGIIGYRALTLTDLPPGGRLGIYGFGGSAHLAAQVALHRGAEVHVLTRSPAAQRLALDLGAASAGGGHRPDLSDAPPVPLDAAILFAPAGELVPPALQALDRGGTLVVAGIHLSEIPPLTYATDLFQERRLRSVTANTRADGEAFLQVAAEIPIRPTVQPYPFEEADRALADLAADRVDGAAVLVVDPTGHA